ncbi:MAG: DUF2490 domain-containing protein [Armatimonadota bacterium]
MRTPFAALAAAASIPVLSSGVQAADTDTQWWNHFTATGHLKPTVRWYAEGQTRISMVDRKSMDRTLLRGAFGYQVSPKWSVWQGFGSTPTYHPKFRDETRSYQQFLFEDKVPGGSVVNRTRFEQRDIQDTSGTSWRVRDMARFVRPLGAGGNWQVVAYDELFWNMNSVVNGPKAGFDQNRVFLGASRKVAPHTRFEFGYLRDDLRLPSGSHRRLDCLVTQFNVTL